jgi:hypothetical protein
MTELAVCEICGAEMDTDMLSKHLTDHEHVRSKLEPTPDGVRL